MKQFIWIVILLFSFILTQKKYTGVNAGNGGNNEQGINGSTGHFGEGEGD